MVYVGLPNFFSILARYFFFNRVVTPTHLIFLALFRKNKTSSADLLLKFTKLRVRYAGSPSMIQQHTYY